ncbi:MAG TPA: DinB family protein [Rubricoccaceae bacterium]|nr:DinB family protein [Rubricoccaceae bacterium]
MDPALTDPAVFRRLAQYDAWANRLLAEALMDEHARACRLLAHVAESELVWLRRIHGTQPASTTADFWPEDDAEAVRARVVEAANAMGQFVMTLDAATLAREAVYRNSQGTEYRTPVADVLHHVFLHSHYHRGQAAAALREAGVAPPWTDYIAWVRAMGD